MNMKESKPLPQTDYNKPVKKIVVEDFRTNEVNTIVLYHSKRRSNAFRATFNGKEWSKTIGYSRIMAAIRKTR